MSTYSATITIDSSSDTTFRAWGSAISTALQAVGLVKTTDTGQINFATVTRVNNPSTAAGYEIYRFADALQSTRPVFLKVEYGTGVNGLGIPAMWITLGSSTDGAGTLTGLALSARRILNTGSNSTAPATCFFSGDGSYLSMVLPNTSFQMLVSISRTCSAAGVDNGDALIFVTNVSNSATIEGFYSYLTSNLLTTNTFALFAVPGQPFSTGIVGGTTYCYPHVINLPKQEYNKALMLVNTADVTNLLPFTVTNCGATHTYLPVVANVMASLFAGYSTMVRYE